MIIFSIKSLILDMKMEPENIPAKKTRKTKEALDSRVFKDGQIYLYRRQDYKKPIWYCRVKVPQSKGYIIQSTKTADEHEAYMFAQTLFNEGLGRVVSGQDISSKRTVIALKEFIEHVEKSEKDNLSRKIKLSLLKRWVNYFGKTRLKDITTATILDLNQWTSDKSVETQKEKQEKANQAFAQKKEEHSHKKARKDRKELIQKKPKPIKSFSLSTIKRITNYQRQFLTWCLDHKFIDVMPRFPKIKNDDSRRPHFDLADYNKLTRYMREFIKHHHPNIVRDRTYLVNYILVLSNTGIRVGEARNLKWRDLREVPNENGGEPNVALFVSGKTGRREVIARTPDVKEYLKRLLEIRKREIKEENEKEENIGKKKKELTTDDYVFCNRNGTPIGSFKTSFMKLLDAAGVTEDSHGNRRSIYSLRHTYATFRIQEGVNHFILAKNMGTSVEMLEKHYGHTTNVTSAAELTKGGTFKGDKNKASAIDWL